MLRNIMMTGTALCLSMGSGLARADHDDELRHVVGGAIIGAALGELAYATGHRSRVYVDYGYGRGYGYRPRRAYPPPRFYAPREHRRWRGGHGFRHRHGHGRGHRHNRYCY